MIDLKSVFDDFQEDLTRDAHTSGEPEPYCFFQRYSQIAAENGDCIDLTYTPVRREGTYGHQIDGYALDIDRGELYIATSDFRADEELQTLNQGQIDSLYKSAERFLKAAQSPDFVNKLEETSPAFEAAYPIYHHYGNIKRVRLIIFSNARFVARKKSVNSKEISGKIFTYNLLDFTRYADILGSRNGSEPIEIDLLEMNGSPLPCLNAYTGSSGFASYLVVMPGELLAKIYGLYGPRLLEQNVRTFLQAKTKVNKGIITTLDQSPEMFFAYNNGLTATASGIEMMDLPGGMPAISLLRNLQIVNGGQTTASILYAKDNKDADLQQVFVQMKLSVLADDLIEKYVPKISRYANTQNKVSDADFFSTHPFHIELEKISRRLSSPQKAGALTTTKWFYERAKGQYKDKRAYGTATDKRRFEAEFPKDQMIEKTDLAKSELSFDCQPHIVSRGRQKCFMSFAEKIDGAWKVNSDNFNEGYFKESVAKILVFRWIDHMIEGSEWYKEDRAFKAQIVTYTIAWLVNHVNKIGKDSIDLQQIWNKQDLSDGLKKAIEVCTPAIAKIIKDAPPNVRNVGEYCKVQLCWSVVSALQIKLPADFKDALIDNTEIKQQKKDEITVKKIDNEVEFEKHLLGLFTHLAEIRSFANANDLLTPKSDSALTKLALGKININYAEKDALKKMFANMTEEGYEFPQENRERI
jgi:hypothetical protein